MSYRRRSPLSRRSLLRGAFQGSAIAVGLPEPGTLPTLPMEHSQPTGSQYTGVDESAAALDASVARILVRTATLPALLSSGRLLIPGAPPGLSAGSLRCDPERPAAADAIVDLKAAARLKGVRP